MSFKSLFTAPVPQSKDNTNVVTTAETVEQPKENVNTTVNTSSPTPSKEVQNKEVIAASKPVVRTQDGIYQCEETDIFNLINISQTFGDYKLFENFNLNIKDFTNKGQFISIMGASGCGKSTLLKYLAGLNKPAKGDILFYGKPLKETDNIPMIFQQYSSFDWMTVLENVALPMKMKGVPKKEREEKAMKLIELVGLKGHENKWAKMPPLSGGQLQRVALARCLATNSNIILLDEYSSGLDILSKHSMQDTLLDVYYSSELDPTFINVGHDISECVYLSNRIYILTANPCKVHSVIDIDFSEYGDRRNSDIRSTDKFGQYVSQIENIMNEINNNKK